MPSVKTFRNSESPVLNNCTNAIRALSMDAVQNANSGHPGAPMGMAEIAEVLWNRHLRYNPANPSWPDRDRFVLSNGHGSMLLYSLLHLTGYDISIDDIKMFRQLHSKTPGHPEYGCTPGVETTTGPLGQGIANAVGMALSEKLLSAEFNRPDHIIVDHYTYCFLGDGCMMEGVSHEACSLAGTLGLSKLIAFYDDNGISIDGHVEGWFTDDTPKRFEAYGWHVVPDIPGHNPDAINAAIVAAKAQNRPTLICCKTVIGMGSPNKAGSHDVHGSPLGDAEITASRAHIGWNFAPFEIPDDVYQAWDGREKGAALEEEWQNKFAAYTLAHPDLASEFKRRVIDRKLPADWNVHVESVINKACDKAENIATRKASQNSIEALASKLPELLGGSADLAGSNLTLWTGSTPVSKASGGNYIHYGVREFGMTAIANGICLHGGLIPYTATFLMFSEYGRNALRMAAMMKLRQICVFTHDSIGLGEDGPTHQPVEQIASLRLIPNMDVWRPCDTVETIAAWAAAIERTDGPSSLCLSRQNLPFIKRDAVTISNIRRGGYILSDCAGTPKAVLIATGSEIDLALKAQAELKKEGIEVRVVSMPSTNIFDRQDSAYRNTVLPKGIVRVSIEAGVTSGWSKYVGLDGAAIGLDCFGESAPACDLFEKFGFTVSNVVATVKAVL